MENTIMSLISIIAFGLSLYNFLESLINSVKKIAIDICNIHQYKISDMLFVYQALITISNKSNLPIAITHLVVNKLPCKIEPSFVSEHKRTKGKEIIYSEIIKTIAFPVNLSSLMSSNGYIEFVSDHPIDKENVKFDIYTNRGKISSVTPTYINRK